MRGLVFLLLVASASAKVFSKCQWAKVLKSSGMDGYGGYSLANWVCLTYHESRYNTRATNRNSNGSTDYGIFQINSHYWCDNGESAVANGCSIKCSALLSDDVSVAIRCAKIIGARQGITAWMAWNTHCRGRDLSTFLSDCNL
ncbi:lysozyme C [Lates calcarifer]|uniref:lysozyme n=1 Tax=Lates calcarifer TaxID=8187 RepID=A0A4W6D985_LATCA|nr:lysozyme C [Lates calcarifer]